MYSETQPVWQAIDDSGGVRSSYLEHFITTGVYSKECMQGQLIPIIVQHHKLRDILFWSGMPSSQYTKILSNYLKSMPFEFAHEAENSAIVLQAREIERLWNGCKSRY